MIKYQTSVNTEHGPAVSLNTGAWEYRCSHATTGERKYQVTGLLTGVSSVTLEARTASSGVSATVSDGKLYAIRVA